MPTALQTTLLILALLTAMAAGCGADRLPGFANPPPVDGGAAGEGPEDDAG